jgi:hypothetical protein
MTGLEIKAAAERYANEYAYVGIRTQEQPYSLGAIYHQSHMWDDGYDTGEQLGGISATNIHSDAVNMHGDGKEHNRRGYYYGDHIAIICGNAATWGEDVGEIIIEDAVVVEIIA